MQRSVDEVLYEFLTVITAIIATASETGLTDIIGNTGVFDVGAIADIGIAVFGRFQVDAMMEGGDMAAEYASASALWHSVEHQTIGFTKRAVLFLEYIKSCTNNDMDIHDKVNNILMMTKYFWDASELPREKVEGRAMLLLAIITKAGEAPEHRDSDSEGGDQQ